MAGVMVGPHPVEAGDGMGLEVEVGKAGLCGIRCDAPEGVVESVIIATHKGVVEGARAMGFVVSLFPPALPEGDGTSFNQVAETGVGVLVHQGQLPLPPLGENLEDVTNPHHPHIHMGISLLDVGDEGLQYLGIRLGKDIKGQSQGVGALGSEGTGGLIIEALSHSGGDLNR